MSETGPFLASLASAGAFAGFCMAFTLSLDFWGRLLLRSLKSEDAAAPDGMIPVMAGAAGAFVLFRWLSFFRRYFEPALAAVVFLGALGALWMLWGRYRAIRLSRGGTLGAAAGRALAAPYEWAASAGLIALALGTWYCRLWPTGTLEPCLTLGIDNYFWIFQAGYWMGYSEAYTFGIEYIHPWSTDSFGTYILFAMYSAARGVPAYLAAPGFAFLLLAWTGASLYRLIRGIAGLPRAIAWLMALALAGGALSRALVYLGVYGQLVAGAGFAALMAEALSGRGGPAPGKVRFLRLFFPLLYILMSYQACYLMFAALAGAALFLRALFAEGAGAAPGAAPPIARPTFAARAAGAFRKAAAPVLAATFLAAAVCPQAAWQVAVRTVSAALQTTGYGLGFLDPGLFAGFPLIEETPFGVKATVTPLDWVAFFGAYAVLCAIALRRRAAAFPGADRAGLKAAAALFAACLAAYLIAFAWKGDVYQIWKFVTMSALPLSCVPAALLVLAVYGAAGGNGKTFAAGLSLAAALIALPNLMYYNPRGPRASFNDVRSLVPMITVMREVLDMDRRADLIIVDFAARERSFSAAVIAQYSQIKRMAFVNGVYLLPSMPLYLNQIQEGAVLYSDRLYPGLYMGSLELPSPLFTVYRYFPEDIRRMGAVSMDGLEPYNRSAGRRIVRLRVLVPQALRGRDLEARITFPKSLAGLEPSCGTATVREGLATPEDSVPFRGVEARIRVPEELQKSGYFSLIAEFPSLRAVPMEEGQAWAYYDPTPCRYRFDKVELSEAQGTASGAEAEPGPAAAGAGPGEGGEPSEGGSKPAF
ncbi:MAG: hypothetical protein LBW85_06785 [Deltaproteobacteria bacterium]|jgi:hypothetical protein|nr:hypothetical protein [Deltaproteobacteria bacterium]